jgi:PPK2 family polyphosphate:nucleotide phosphotransferase
MSRKGDRGSGAENRTGKDKVKKRKEQLKKIEELVRPYRISSGKGFKLSDIDPGDTHEIASEMKNEAKELLSAGVEWLAELQDRLYAHDRYGVLVIFQAMDAAGKDGTIKHVMSGVNPQGCQVFSFKQPSAEELDHDFMWRYSKCLPERGRIGIFNRSYYEEVLVVRVHELLESEKLPAELVTKEIWNERMEDIAAFERYLQRNGIIVLKFYLHLSKKEQKKRFLARIDKPEKNWKFSKSDVVERQYWKDYMRAFEDVIKQTSTKESPWHVVPADNKWFARLVVAAAIVERLEKLNLAYPVVSEQKMKELLEAKEALEKASD